MKKEYLLMAILALVIVVLSGFLLWPMPAKGPKISVGITVENPKKGAEVTSPVKISGMVNGDGWNGFEGQVGTVKLLDYKGNEIGLAILTATSDWMKPQVSFETTLNFAGANDGPATLVFKNENPSGDSARDKTFSLPIIIKSSGEFSTLKVYFGNSEFNPATSCNKVFAVDRRVPKTEAVARAALEELLSGPTGAESNEKYFTSINIGVKIKSLKIENGTAFADFDEALQKNVGGSCRVSAIRAQIEQTLKQFSTVKNVVISINGRIEDILQP